MSARLPWKYRWPVLAVMAVSGVFVVGTDNTLGLLGWATIMGVALAFVERWMLRHGFDR